MVARVRQQQKCLKFEYEYDYYAVGVILCRVVVYCTQTKAYIYPVIPQIPIVIKGIAEIRVQIAKYSHHNSNQIRSDIVYILGSN